MQVTPLAGGGVVEDNTVRHNGGQGFGIYLNSIDRANGGVTGPSSNNRIQNNRVSDHSLIGIDHLGDEWNELRSLQLCGQQRLARPRGRRWLLRFLAWVRLKTTYLAAQRGLAHMQALGGPPEVELLGDCDERLEVPDIHLVPRLSGDTAWVSRGFENSIAVWLVTGEVRCKFQVKKQS